MLRRVLLEKLSNDMPESRLPDFFHRLELFATRPQTVQRDEVVGIGLGVLGVTVVSVSSEGGQRVIYCEKEELANSYKQLAQQLISQEGWSLHLKNYEKLLFLFGQTRSLSLEIEDGGAVTALLAYKSWLRSLEQFGEFILAPFVVEKHLDQMCYELVQRYYPQNIEETWGVITSPSELHAFQRMRVAITEAVLQDQDKQKAAKKLTDDFGWYNEYSFVEPLLGVGHFIQELDRLSSEEAREERDKILSEQAMNKEAFEAFMHACPDPALRQLAKVVHMYTFLRTDRVDQMKITQVPLRRVFEVLKKLLESRTSVDWTAEMLAALTCKEVMDVLEGKFVPNCEEVQIRAKQDYVYFRVEGDAHTLVGKEVVHEAKACILASQPRSEVIKGRVAFHGLVQGRVALVLHKQDLANVQPGDILVAKTTMPDYTPAMKIAAAFVTEEGGVTSHAAIIARELKKPCIVGTGNCTKLLKEGDMVEVDANNGTVQKIK